MSTTERPEIVNPEDMNKAACTTWLRGRNAFAGHSRSSLPDLRKAVAAVQLADELKADETPAPAKPAPRQRRGESVSPVPDPDTDPAWVAEVKATAETEGITETGAAIVVAARRTPSPELLAAAEAASAPKASDDRIERLSLAKAEHKALQAWVTSGKDGDRPSTPNLDAMNADYAAGTRTSKSPGRSKAPAEVQTPGLRFHRRGTPMTDGQNRLSCVAYQATAGLGADGGKLSVVELKALLKDRYGIDRPSSSAWEVTFDNGITAGATLPPER